MEKEYCIVCTAYNVKVKGKTCIDCLNKLDKAYDLEEAKKNAFIHLPDNEKWKVLSELLINIDKLK